MLEKIIKFFKGFLKVEYNVELPTETRPFINSTAVNKFYNEIRYIPFYDVKFGLTKYSVTKMEYNPANVCARLLSTQKCESFTKISIEYVKTTKQKNFFVDNYIYVYGIDQKLWKVQISGYISGIVKNNEFDNNIVNAFITYCNDILDGCGLVNVLKTDCTISFLEDKSNVYNRHIDGYTIINSSNTIWTNGTVEEIYIRAFSNIGIYKDLGINRICPDIEENGARDIPINFTDQHFLNFSEKLKEIVEIEHSMSPMIVKIHN